MAVEVSVTSFLYIFLLLLLLKAHIMCYHSRLQYFCWLCNLHWILYSVFTFLFYKVPKLNERECKFQQEVFIIRILKCIKLPLEKMVEYVFGIACFYFDTNDANSLCCYPLFYKTSLRFSSYTSFFFNLFFIGMLKLSCYLKKVTTK